MGKGVLPGTEALEQGGGYIAVAALNGPDDKPDMSTARAFIGTVAQGISYNAGIWRESKRDARVASSADDRSLVVDH